MVGSEYNFSSRFLHRIALQSNALAEMSFDIDNLSTPKKGRDFDDRPVFISGLARSGTTMLMRYLHGTGKFRSLTYMDMPFVLMPGIWSKLASKKSGELKERAHRDGIMVSFESPEALEEVFWRVFSGKMYIGSQYLEFYLQNSGLRSKFADYVHNIIASDGLGGSSRYLSKNNNNVLRLPALLKTFPAASILIPFRDPLQHALSLLQQHNHFSDIQSKDPFALQYMNWLGHFEFGLNHKPFRFGTDDQILGRMKNYALTDLNYWLLNWLNYYTFAISHAPEKALFVSYEIFCEKPLSVLTKLFTLLQVDRVPEGIKSFTPSVKKETQFDDSIFNECLLLHQQLENNFKGWFN